MIHSLPALPQDFLSEAPTLEVTLLIPARNSAHALENTVRHADAFLSKHYPSYEIILIPNPGTDSHDRSLEVAQALASRFPSVRVEPHPGLPGKGAALRTGLASARGQWIFFTDADLPYELEFFARATAKLASGYSLVTGNRRLPTSQFNIPVGLLHLAYGRHRLGLGFNHVVRWIFGVRTTDTQAGIKAMSRHLAREAFLRMQCPGFFFDLEIFLCARRMSFKHVELPVVLNLNTEKSTVRILRDGMLAAYWLTRIALRNMRGEYGKVIPCTQTS